MGDLQIPNNVGPGLTEGASCGCNPSHVIAKLPLLWASPHAFCALMNAPTQQCTQEYRIRKEFNTFLASSRASGKEEEESTDSNMVQ